MAWSCATEGSGWGLGKGSAAEGGQALAEDLQGSEIKNHLNNTLKSHCLIFGWSCVEPGADLNDQRMIWDQCYLTPP